MKTKILFLAVLAMATACGFPEITYLDCTGGGSPGTTASTGGACLCDIPDSFNSDCRDLTYVGDGPCVEEIYPNFAACRGGVGVCFGGVCSPPNWSAQCIQSIGDGSWSLCDDVSDCDDENPCTSDTCPHPGCEPCRHVPVEDLTVCEAGMVCRQGACCDKPSDL